jgi:hypothetical protein
MIFFCGVIAGAGVSDSSGRGATDLLRLRARQATTTYSEEARLEDDHVPEARRCASDDRQVSLRMLLEVLRWVREHSQGSGVEMGLESAFAARLSCTRYGTGITP